MNPRREYKREMYIDTYSWANGENSYRITGGSVGETESIGAVEQVVGRGEEGRAGEGGLACRGPRGRGLCNCRRLERWSARSWIGRREKSKKQGEPTGCTLQLNDSKLSPLQTKVQIVQPVVHCDEFTVLFLI